MGEQTGRRLAESEQGRPDPSRVSDSQIRYEGPVPWPSTIATSHAQPTEKRYVPSILVAACTDGARIRRRAIFGYARYSDEKQREASIERQKEGIDYYVGSMGRELDGFFVDRGVTGTTSQRPGLNDLLEACKANPGCIVVVENVDRLYRSRVANAQIFLEMQRYGVELHDRTGRLTDLTEMIKAAIASEDRTKILERMHAGRRSQILADGYVGSKVPFGYVRTARRRIDPDPEKAEIVRRIFEMRASGLTFERIVAEMSERLIAPPAGTVWHSSTVSRLLSNTTYVGFCVWNLRRPAGTSENGEGTERIVRHIPRLAIVDPDTFERVAARSCNNRSLRHPDRISRSRGVKFLLSRRCRCSCGNITSLGSEGMGGHRQFVCSKQPHDNPGCGKTYRMRPLEKFAVRGLRQLLDLGTYGPIFMDQLEKAREAGTERVEADRRRLDAQASQLRRDIDSAMQVAYSDPRLAALKEADLVRLHDLLDETVRERQILSRSLVPSVSEEAVLDLGQELDRLETLAPFNPLTDRDRVLRDTFRAIVVEVRVSRVSKGMIDVEVDYDLGPIAGVSTDVGRVTKHFRYDAHGQMKESMNWRRERANLLLESIRLEFSDAEYERLADNEHFRSIFATECDAGRRSVLRSLAIRAATGLPNATARKMTGCERAGLIAKAAKFRRSPGCGVFVKVLRELLPNVDVSLAQLFASRTEASDLGTE